MNSRGARRDSRPSVRNDTAGGADPLVRAGPPRTRFWLLLRLHAGAVVGLQIAERVLHAGQDVLQHRLDGVDTFAVAVGFVEDAPLTLAADPAQTVVVVGARIVFLGLVGGTRLVVIDARQDVQVGARISVHAESVSLVVNLELLPVKHGGDRALGVVDLDGNQLRVPPVELEEAADHLIELGPCAHLRVAALLRAAGCGGRRRRQHRGEARREILLAHLTGLVRVEFDKMIGGFFKFHWVDPQLITVKIDDPKSPVTAMFHGQEFEIHDETYTFGMDTYSRTNLHILTSIDYDKMSAVDKAKEDYPRADHDYGLSWIRREGKGRVFYEAHGHNERVYAIKPVLKRVRAGVQYAIGDLKAADSPGVKR